MIDQQGADVEQERIAGTVFLCQFAAVLQRILKRPLGELLGEPAVPFSDVRCVHLRLIAHQLIYADIEVGSQPW